MNHELGFDCMIAAGGVGSRLGLQMPKCLLRVRGRTLLELNIEQCKLAGIQKILVLCDNEQWLDTEIGILSHYENIALIKDKGYSSTFELCRDYVKYMNHRFLFLYGHAPRGWKSLKYNFLTSGTEQRCSLVERSSRRQPISWKKGFIEPPFKLRSDWIASSKGKTWVQYFNARQQTFGVVRLGGPAEFNNEAEYKEFVRHLDWAA